MSCRLCGAPSTTCFEVQGRAYVECPSCSYLALAGRDLPSREVERERYLLHRNDLADPGYRSFLEGFVLKALEPRLAPGAAILDYGSGPSPALSLLLRERGYRCSSYDPFFAPSQAWRRRSWDCIIVHEVAEHLRMPGVSFGALARRLAPGGLLAVRSRFLPPTREAFATWWYRSDATHVGFFSPRSFARLAELLGLAVLALEAPDLALFRRPVADAAARQSRSPA